MADIISITVVCTGESDMFFNVRKSTTLEKIVVAYCARKGLARGELCFLFDGDRFSKEDTIASLDVEDNDRWARHACLCCAFFGDTTDTSFCGVFAAESKAS